METAAGGDVANGRVAKMAGGAEIRSDDAALIIADLPDTFSIIGNI